MDLGVVQIHFSNMTTEYRKFADVQLAQASVNLLLWQFGSIKVRRDTVLVSRTNLIGYFLFTMSYSVKDKEKIPFYTILF